MYVRGVLGTLDMEKCATAGHSSSLPCILTDGDKIQSSCIPIECIVYSRASLEEDQRKVQGSVQRKSLPECYSVISLTACNSEFVDDSLQQQGQIDQDVWEIIHPEQALNVVKSSEEAPQQRIRRKRRPFSPEPIGNHIRKTSAKSKLRKRGAQDLKADKKEDLQAQSFSCDKCCSPYIVNPSRSRLPLSQLKKIPTKRKKFDAVANKVLNLCNACGLAYSRPAKAVKEAALSVEDRDKYLAEAVSFAKSVALRVGNAAAERLYCPSFKKRPCACIQTYISHEAMSETEGDTLETRVGNLLQLYQTSSDLGRQRKGLPERPDLEKNNKPSNPLERKQRHRESERFILETRQFLREKLRLCERACQRILLYSNNFLHKRLKSSPDQSSRLPRKLGRNPLDQLKPIEELGSTSCCLDNCSRLALTHSTLLSEWRKQAAQGQRQARRVLAEMLTPSGGTKANCYKFITMVTGCGPSTISSVSHQMRVTKGKREPPEHGLKKWYRENPRKKSKIPVSEGQCSENQQASHNNSLVTLNVHVGQSEPVPTEENQDARQLLEEQRKELEEAKRQLYLKQQELDNCQKIIDQHLQQQALCDVSSSSSNSIWKVNVMAGSSNAPEVNTQIVNLYDESGITVLPDVTCGQSVELLDLVPGTYIAVPANFGSPGVLTVAPDLRNTNASGASVLFGDLNQQDVVYTDIASVQQPNISSPNDNVLVSSENCVQTILNVSSGTEGNSSILDEMQNDFVGEANNGSKVFVPSACTEINLSGSELNSHIAGISTIPEFNSPSPSNSADDPLKQPFLKSLPTSVIIPSGQLHPKCDSQYVPVVNFTPSFKCNKDIQCIGNYNIPTSDDSVDLVAANQPPPPPQLTSTSLNELERFFE